jgi:hypothetical protein
MAEGSPGRYITPRMLIGRGEGARVGVGSAAAGGYMLGGKDGKSCRATTQLQGKHGTAAG